MRMFGSLWLRFSICCLLAAGMVASSPADEPVYWVTDPAITTKPMMVKNPRLNAPKLSLGSMHWKEVGHSRVLVCVGPDGAITEAVPAGSSKIAGLDAAFMAWVVEHEFSPGQLGAIPAEVCGVELVWAWQSRKGGRAPPRVYPEYGKLKPDSGPMLSPKTLPPVRAVDSGASPRHAKAGRQQFDLCVGPTGSVEEVIMTSGLMNPILNDAGVAWARSLSFEPASKGGRSVGVCGIELDYIWPKVE